MYRYRGFPRSTSESRKDCGGQGLTSSYILDLVRTCTSQTEPMKYSCTCMCIRIYSSYTLVNRRPLKSS